MATGVGSQGQGSSKIKEVNINKTGLNQNDLLDDIDPIGDYQ